MPGRPGLAGSQAAVIGGRPVSLGYQGCGMLGSSTFGCGTGPQGGSSRLFAGIKKSSSGKSTYWITINWKWMLICINFDSGSTKT